MEWEHFWNQLLDEHKLRSKVNDMNQVDLVKNGALCIEQICHQIYDEYDSLKDHYEQIRDDFWKIIETIDYVHLHTSRIKSIDSLLVKVVTKRYRQMMDRKSRYAGINGSNYKDIMTDLIGLRLIVSYRGNWKNIHEKLIHLFPFNSEITYDEEMLMPHVPNQNYQAECPKAYYAQGDDIQEYIQYGLIPKLHNMNYRSIHYTISFEGAYIELQIRTIYDEAWSDCNHNYVYKKEDNKSYIALEQMSSVLSKLTNLSNDIGEQMKDIYDKELITVKGEGNWYAPLDIVQRWDQAIMRLEVVEREIAVLRGKMVAEKEDGKA